MSSLVLFPTISAERRTELIDNADIPIYEFPIVRLPDEKPLIDLDEPLVGEDRIRRLAAHLGIPVEAFDMPMNDDNDLQADPHDIGPLAERLADAFVAAQFAKIQRAFTQRSPLYAAALSLEIYTRLPPDERENFAALVNRMARHG